MAKVLVVDNDRGTAESFADSLGLRGHDVQIATTKAEAVSLAREFRPDLITVDGHIAAQRHLDGLKLAQQLRGLLGSGPVIAMLSASNCKFEGIGFDKGDAPEVLDEILALLNRPK